MPHSIQDWEKRCQAAEAAAQMGREAVRKSKALFYRVAGLHFEAAFVLFLIRPSADWRSLLRQALELYSASDATNECQGRKGYPYNLAHLRLEWYLGHRLLGEAVDEQLLTDATNLYVEGLWGQHQQRLSAFGVLPPVYLMRQDFQHLKTLWQTLGNQTDLTRLPSELELWKHWSDLYAAQRQGVQIGLEAFVQPYLTFQATVDDPTRLPARFFLSILKIAQDTFGIDEDTHSLITRLNVVENSA